MIGLILASVEGTLDSSSRARLEAHAASCVGCRRALDEQAAVKRMLAELPTVSVSRGFAARVRERIEPRPWWMPVGNWRLWTLRLAPIAALLTILAWLPLQTDATGSGTVTTTATSPVSALESWATGATEGDGSIRQLLDPSVHAHTLLAPSASQATSTSTPSSTTGGTSR